MRIFSTKSLEGLIVCLVVLTFALVFSLTNVNFALKTAEGTLDLSQINATSGQVLGVKDSKLENSNLSNSCPNDQPIIGWINFEGKKVILKSLLTSQKASACFKTTLQANQNGYF
jgi:hypothetical protein